MAANTGSNWVEQARALATGEVLEKLPVPFHVLTAEAVDAVRFAQRTWQPELDSQGREVRPGLLTAVGQGRFTEATLTELLELIDELQRAQTNYRLLAQPSAAAPMERSQFVLGELRAMLQWCADDGAAGESAPEELDARLVALAEAHEGAFSQDALAAALFDYAELASRSRAFLDRLAGFDADWIEEARSLGQRLREQSAGPSEPGAVGRERTALDLRNRLATLVYERVLRIRSAARFALRHHPALLLEVSSAYGRKQRAAHRRRKSSSNNATASEPSAALVAPAVTPAVTPAVRDGK
ncbi:MAG TPA: hypothetical protein VLC09_19045 [Polyangiaceae bacterium]|nr:hypothetical protein [Polyangiaceae bacterium]